MTDPYADFIRAACAPRTTSHSSGTLEDAEAILAAHPVLNRSDIHIAAILGDASSVERFLSTDPASAVTPGGPYNWDPLTHLCFSRYLRIDRGRSEGFVRAATLLLDAGANPNSGFFEGDHPPRPEWESVLYGAAGIAHHAGVTELLVSRGADPNDGEVTYHAPEGYDNTALSALLGCGRMSSGSLATMLLRKADWHDLDGLRLLLEHGADPNQLTHWGWSPLCQAIRRDNDLTCIDLLLDHGGDPLLFHPTHQLTPAGTAIRRGRGDVLESLGRRGIDPAPTGVERLILCCALGREADARALAAEEPALLQQLLAEGGTVLAEFAGTANASGVGILLDLGVPVSARYGGDGYFGISADSTALHVAAWRAWHDVVDLLLRRGAEVDARDGTGRTPLQLAVRACVDSYWKWRRAPESVAALLRAGASPEGIPWPSGYDAVDELLRPTKS